MFPMLANFSGYFSITVTGKINQETTAPQLKEIYVLGTSGCFADESKTGTISERVDSAGLTRIGASGKGYLHAIRRRQLPQLIDSGIKCCVLKDRHIFPDQPQWQKKLLTTSSALKGLIL
jgi:hypothetical protein